MRNDRKSGIIVTIQSIDGTCRYLQHVSILEETDHFQARGDQVGIHQFHTLDHFGSHLGHIWVIFLPKCEPCRAMSCFKS